MRFTLEQMSSKTIPDLFLERRKESSQNVAFRYKHLGIYREVTWGQYWEQVENFAFGLLDLGLNMGDRVAIMGDPCPEWIYADLATLCAGGINYGVYTTSSLEEIEYLMQTGGAKFFVAENQEYVDKILQISERLESLIKIVVIDTKAMFMYQDSRLISFSEVQEQGRQRKERYPQELSHRMKQMGPCSPSFLIFTSGTAGPPKPALLTHRNALMGFVWSVGEVFPDLWTHEHRSIAHLSMAHIYERGFTVLCPLVYRIIPHIGESIQYLQETIYEVQPTLFHGVPRVWEKIASQTLVGIEHTSWIKRVAYRLAERINRRYLMRGWEAKPSSWLWQCLHRAAFEMTFRHLLHKLGLNRVKHAISGGAPLPVATQVLWQTWGVPLRSLYGASEAGGLISAEREGFPQPGTVGKPTSVCTVRLGEDGEVMVSGPGVFLGYWNDDEATREAIRAQWLQTGDIAEWTNDGNLKLIDRKKDIMITSGGKNISPSLLELSLKESPYISEAVIIADGRKYPSVLIEIDFETVSEWARRNGILYTSYTSLASHPRAYALIAGEVEKSNQKFARVEQVKQFRIIPKELDPEEGDTTATRKIKRKRIYQMFHGLIEEMYAPGKGNLGFQPAREAGGKRHVFGRSDDTPKVP